MGEPLRRELQRPRPRRAVEHRRVRLAPRSPSRCRSMADRVQHLPTPRRPRRTHPRRSTRRMDHRTPTSTLMTAGPPNGVPVRASRSSPKDRRRSRGYASSTSTSHLGSGSLIAAAVRCWRFDWAAAPPASHRLQGSCQVTCFSTTLAPGPSASAYEASAPTARNVESSGPLGPHRMRQ